MYRHYHVLNLRCRKLLASALIQSHFDYGVSAWYSATTKQCKQKLQVAQNKLVRFILNLDARAHIGQPELNQLNMLNTSDRAQQMMLHHMFNVYHNSAPSYLSQGFTKVQSQHRYSTRNADHSFVVPNSKGASRFNFTTQGVKFWNNLPIAIRNLEVKNNFKSKVKPHLQQCAINNELSEFVYY